jgi:hypothetical protein
VPYGRKSPLCGSRTTESARAIPSSVARPGLAGPERDDLNRRVLDGINRRARVHVSGAVLETERAKGFVLRFCVLNFRTHARRMEMALEDVRAAVAESA